MCKQTAICLIYSKYEYVFSWITIFAGPCFYRYLMKIYFATINPHIVGRKFLKQSNETLHRHSFTNRDYL